MPLPHATGVYGQLPGRDFNPLDLLLLLRTVSVICFRDRKKITLTAGLVKKEALDVGYRLMVAHSKKLGMPFLPNGIILMESIQAP